MAYILTVHCQTDWNVAHRIQGHTDIELNATGRDQAKELARLLEKEGASPTRIVCSPLKRAHETAAIIGTALAVAVQADPRIKECTFGDLEGLTGDEARERYGELLFDLGTYDFRPFNGESRQEVLHRHLACLTDHLRRNINDTILFVGHRRGMKTVLHHVGQEPNFKDLEYKILDYSLVS